MTTQPHYPDGTRAWAVDAIRAGGSQKRITTTYVRAHTRQEAAAIGVHQLRRNMGARVKPGPWRVSARPAHAVHDLGMEALEESG